MQRRDITSFLTNRMIGFSFLRACAWRIIFYITLFYKKACFNKIFNSFRTKLLNPIILVIYNINNNSVLFVLVVRILVGQQDLTINREVLV